ncbi:LOW QUALITY PROTEIN: lutropin subunit beta [Loxodonta africana]|uniref:LOW QUALITY PROTEIN: lutropin subunit beta n=1 Tax=Loxodonta africana TaxID=9785 RepID=UPI0030D52EE9
MSTWACDAALPQGLLLWLLLGGVWASRGPLRPLCRPINATLTAEKEACPVCITFTTSICAGYCPSMVRVLPAALPPVPQPVCTYRELRFASVRLPGCPPGVDPMVSFPVALSCWCGPCRLSSSDCGGPRAQPVACDSPHFQASSSSKDPFPAPNACPLPEPAATPSLPSQ